MTGPYPPYSSGYPEDDSAASNRDRTVDISLYLQDLKLETAELRQEIRSLRSQSTWLKVILALLILVLGGSLAWATLRFQALENFTAQDADQEKLADVLSQIDLLRQRFSALESNTPSNVTAILQDQRNQLRQLEVQIEQLRARSSQPTAPNSDSQVPNETAPDPSPPTSSVPSSLPSNSPESSP